MKWMVYLSNYFVLTALPTETIRLRCMLVHHRIIFVLRDKVSCLRESQSVASLFLTY